MGISQPLNNDHQLNYSQRLVQKFLFGTRYMFLLTSSKVGYHIQVPNSSI
jgi:hypothetical protein